MSDELHWLPDWQRISDKQERRHGFEGGRNSRDPPFAYMGDMKQNTAQFLARDSIYAENTIFYRPAVCPPLRLSVTRVDQ